VQAEFHLVGQYLESLAGFPAPQVLVEHDPGSTAARIKPATGIQRLKQRVELATWRRYEQDLYRRVQAVVVFTGHDEEAVAPLAGSTQVVRIPLGTELPGDDDHLHPGKLTSPSVPDERYILFAGNFIHPPNVDAALRAARQIYPRLQPRYPGLKLYLVGMNPPEELRQVASEQIVITGEVPDMVPYLEGATVVLAPIRQGGGMRVKVLEALAAGKPLVATRLAVAGLDVTGGRQVLLAESDQDLADKVACLLDDEERRQEIGREAAAWARQNLSWDATVDKYEALYRRLLEARAP
jgi:glycosyltransferase involved in cell wall biosynthesis